MFPVRSTSLFSSPLLPPPSEVDDDAYVRVSSFASHLLSSDRRDAFFCFVVPVHKAVRAAAAQDKARFVVPWEVNQRRM